MNNIEYFYVRAKRGDGSIHRVGLIGLGCKQGYDSVFISGSFCSVNDQFNRFDAIQKMGNRMFFRDRCFKVPNCNILKKISICDVLKRLNFYQPACKQGVNFIDLESMWVSFRDRFIEGIRDGR